MIRGYFKNLIVKTIVFGVFSIFIIGCGSSGQSLTRGVPLEDQLVNFNVSWQSSDETAALMLISEEERSELSSDGISFSEEYRIAIGRIRITTLKQNQDLGLDGDGLIVGMKQALDNANKAKHHIVNTNTSKVSSESNLEEAPKAPIEEAPAAPIEEAPAAPIEEAPAAPIEEAPAAPIEEAPAAPTEEAPKAPIEEAPKAPADDDGFVDL